MFGKNKEEKESNKQAKEALKKQELLNTGLHHYQIRKILNQ